VRPKHNNGAVKQLLTQTKLKDRVIPDQRQQQLCLKTICIHNHVQLSEFTDIFLRKERVILIVRISPFAIKDPEARIDIVNELYKHATKNNYSVFRQGEERVVVVHSSVKVDDILAENSLLSSQGKYSSS
jgi:SepF-like predicted cell division protein (DUF552 family)